MKTEDIQPVIDLAGTTFTDLDRRRGRPPEPPRTSPFQVARHRHLLTVDPDGQWVSEAEDGTLTGAACALRRGGLWGLSLLVVHPDTQGQGLGRRLLERALETARDADGAMIISSTDPRAIRRYAAAGFALWPTLGAHGVVRRDCLDAPDGVRDGDAGDLAHTEAVDREVRGAAHGADVLTMLEGGMRLSVSDEGYAVYGEHRVVVLAARTPYGAADLLRAALIAMREDGEIHVNWITAAQQWAISPVLAAGLSLRPEGPICTRGRLGPLTPYLPSGAFL